MKLSQKRKIFPIFLFHFWNLHQVLNILKKKTIVIANIFPKLQIVKNLVRSLSKKRLVRTPFASQHINREQTFVKSSWQNSYQISSSPWGKVIWKISPLVICEILGVFVHTLTTDDKYPVRYCENLSSSIQMELF